MNQKQLIVIGGPTAVGKSDIAFEIAQILNTEIISADARQCFKELNIGTAKPSEKELVTIKHHFINSHSIQDKMSVGIFERYALAAAEKIFINNNTAILVGGTGLYINALLFGIDPMPEVDEKFIQRANTIFLNDGIEGLKKEILNYDTYYFNHGQMDNPARMMRALAFAISNNKSILDFKTGEKTKRDFAVKLIGLEMYREELYKRINLRVDNMMKNGLYEEVKNLYPERNNPNLRTVGYQEFFESGKMADTKGEIVQAVEKIKQHSRNYAKRQLTWFKNKGNFTWYDVSENKQDRNKLLQNILNNINQ